MKKAYNLSLFLPLLLVTLVGCNNNQNGGNDEPPIQKVEKRTLNFYALNDFHGSYLYDESYSQTGLSRIGKYLMDKKNEDKENTFILSSGDMFQGGAESNITYGDVVIDAMNIIGFDSMTIGNHEFDWGEEKLKEMESKMNFPLLGYNIYYSDTLTRPDFLKPSTIIKKEGLNVGIIGAVEGGINSSILPTIADDFYYPEEIEKLKEEAKRLKEEEDCDIVVLSTHDGAYRTYDELSDYFNDKETYIDALFLGHDHKKRSGSLNNHVKYVEAGSNGAYISHIKLDLELDKESNHYYVTSSYSENIETFNYLTEESKEINDNYLKYKEQVESIRDEVLYTFNQSLSKSDFGEFVAYSLLKYSNDEKILNDNLISLGIVNSGGIRTYISSGEFTYGDLIKAYPFENALCVLKVTSSQYSTFTSSNNYMYQNNEIYEDSDGYRYIATVDYLAYQDYYEKVGIYEFKDNTCRDIVKEVLKKEGSKWFN